MRTLTVLYDETCGFCTRCGTWMLGQPARARIDLLPRGSLLARKRYPDLAALPDELVVIVDGRDVYREEKAWIVCLLALRRYRSWGRRLATPALMPLARQAFMAIARNRHILSELLGLETDEALAARLSAEPAATCAPALRPEAAS